MRTLRLRTSTFLLVVGFMAGVTAPAVEAAPPGQSPNWGRFYQYPYVYDPRTVRQSDRSSHLFYRYPTEARIPIYRKDWINFYAPRERPYNIGHQMTLDVF